MWHFHTWTDWREIYRDTTIFGDHIKQAAAAGIPLSQVVGTLVIRQERYCLSCKMLQLRTVTTQ